MWCNADSSQSNFKSNHVQNVVFKGSLVTHLGDIQIFEDNLLNKQSVLKSSFSIAPDFILTIFFLGSLKITLLYL